MMSDTKSSTQSQGEGGHDKILKRIVALDHDVPVVQDDVDMDVFKENSRLKTEMQILKAQVTSLETRLANQMVTRLEKESTENSNGTTLNDSQISMHLSSERSEFEAMFYLQKEEYEAKIKNVVKGMNAQFETRFNSFAEGLQESEMYLQCERQAKYIEELTAKIILQEVTLAVQRTSLAKMKGQDQRRAQVEEIYILLL